MTRNVTFTTMIQTDGRTQKYGVYRAPLHNAEHARPRQFIDLNAGVKVAEIVTSTSPRDLDYYAASALFETPEHPAFAFESPRSR